MSKPLTEQEERRRVIEYVSGVQTGVMSHTEATEGIMGLLESQKDAAVSHAYAPRLHIRKNENQSYCGWGTGVVYFAESLEDATCKSCLRLVR